jgi:hypothetical protein
MTPMSVLVGVMDSQRPGSVVTVPVEVLGPSTRALRGLKRMALVSVIGVCIVPIPLLHLCGVLVALIVGPIAGVFAWQAKALLGACAVPCAKCNEPLAIPEGQAGWPARVHCAKCGAMVEFNPA